MPSEKVALQQARAHWHAKSGLASKGTGKIAETLATTGWPRTLGGIDVYLAVGARCSGVTRATLEEAVDAGKVQVVPAVRGCIHLVPREQVPLVLAVADEQARKRSLRELEKVDVAPKEVEAIGAEVVKVLKKGALTTDAIRRALPEGTVRSLGEKGKKLGMSSTLPTAIRWLEFDGKVERTLEGGRLDTERYLWRLPKGNPLTGKVPKTAEERYARIAEVFFRTYGPATLADFAAWAGVAQRDAKGAVEELGLRAVDVDGYGAALVFEDEMKALKAAKGSGEIALLPFEDNHAVVHGGPGVLVDEAHHGVQVPEWQSGKPETLAETKHLSLRAMMAGEKIVGFWEWDAKAGRVVWGAFGKVKKGAVDDEAERVSAMIGELGHARSFSLDTDAAVQERAELVKGMRQ